MISQRKVWNKIAPNWYEFRNVPQDEVTSFLKNKSGNILDLGSGSGRNCVKLGKPKRYYCVDFSKKMLEFAKQNLKERDLDANFIKSETFKIPFEDNFFDASICIAVLHCINSKEKRIGTLKEIYRNLKKGKYAFINSLDKKHRLLKNK